MTTDPVYFVTYDQIAPYLEVAAAWFCVRHPECEKAEVANELYLSRPVQNISDIRMVHQALRWAEIEYVRKRAKDAQVKAVIEQGYRPQQRGNGDGVEAREYTGWLLSLLEPRERIILIRRSKGQTFKAIGQRYGRSDQWALNQIKKIRDKLARKERLYERIRHSA